MAIVNMKRIFLIGMKEDQQSILKILQKHGSVEISDLNTDKTDYEPVHSAELERVRWCINYIGKLRPEKKPLLASDTYISQNEAENVLQNKEQILSVVRRCEDIEREKGRIQTEILKKNAEIEELLPFEELDIYGSDIKNSTYTKSLVGYISNSALERVGAKLQEESLLAQYETVSEIKGQSYIYIISHNDSYQEVLKIFKDNGFAEVQVPKENKTVKSMIADLHKDIESIKQSEEKLTAELVELAKQTSEIEKLYDILSIDFQRQEQRYKFLKTQSTFLLMGWIPQPSVDELKKDLYDLNENIELEICDPQDDEVPPVLLKNNKFAAPFESIVKGFSYPSPSGYDPTAVMAPFYANFFGMMLSDAGYGLLMLIAIPLLLKKFNPKIGTKNLMKVMLFGGLATLIWGALYNTWFGFSPLPLALDPVNKPMPVMMVCLALGALHLFAGLAVAAYMNIQKGEYLEAVYSQLSWAFLLIGLGMLLVPSLSKIGKALAIIGALTIVITAGRGNKNIFSRMVSGFGALYGVMGWISDLLSYMRLFGMGLATGVIGMVINILVGMMFEGGIFGAIIGSVIFVFAHLFNFGINALGAYVHSCRLQYIEFFGKFYEDGGRAFNPLEEKTRYIKILNDK